jgi:alpha-galactosidase
MKLNLITYDKKERAFHLRNSEISYLIQIEENDYLAHLYFGKRITDYSGNFRYPRLDRSFSPNPPNSINRLFSLDTLMMEYPGGGFGDFREPAHKIRLSNNTTINDFRYKNFEIIGGKPRLEGLPATYTLNNNEAQTLKIILQDQISNLELNLMYTIYAERNVITRSCKLTNNGNKNISIEKLASMNIDFLDESFDVINLHGTWAKERHISREKMSSGIKIFDSKRGSSSHQQNPFIALAKNTTTEFDGEVYGFSLVYSGSHQILLEKDPYQQTRLTMGINPENFSWQLQPKESFQTPESVMVYSNDGLNEMSATFHDLYKQRLIRGKFQFEPRPILINNWEATYFDFNKNKLIQIIDKAKDIGIEMFVLDDGWFGERNNDSTSLGDWFENTEKLGGSLNDLSKYVHSKDMKFGLWVEPEMISINSDLFRNHPDWILRLPERLPSTGRDQLVLDYSRKDVRDNVFDQLSKILDNNQIDYIKWDMNRNLTDVYSQQLPDSQQGEVEHRYILGLYEILEKLINKYPKILFESCSGGGGRFDPGMLYYMPQVWTSDNTDAIDRLKIQYGTSLVYPISSMGAHVSDVPNHQTGRTTSLDIRGKVAMSGLLGYELDLAKQSIHDLESIKNQIKFYKKHRQLIQYGEFIRLISPFESNDVSWMFLSKDKTEALVFYFRMLSEASYPLVHLKLQKLEKNKRYLREETGQIYYGDELMNLGFYTDPGLKGNSLSEVYYFKQEI